METGRKSNLPKLRNVVPPPIPETHKHTHTPGDFSKDASKKLKRWGSMRRSRGVQVKQRTEKRRVSACLTNRPWVCSPLPLRPDLTTDDKASWSPQQPQLHFCCSAQHDTYTPTSPTPWTGLFGFTLLTAAGANWRMSLFPPGAAGIMFSWHFHPFKHPSSA